MSDKGKTERDQALDAIRELDGSHDLKFCMDIALDAIGGKLAKNPLFKDLGIKPEATGISDVLDALVRAGILSEDDKRLPDEFDEAMGDLYPFGNTPEEVPGRLLADLHERLKEAIDVLAEKDSEAKEKVDQEK